MRPTNRRRDRTERDRDRDNRNTPEREGRERDSFANAREDGNRRTFARKEKRTNDRKLYAPASGSFLSLSDVKDPVYAQKMYGEGIALVPQGDLVVSPCSGTVALIPVRKQAIGLETESGDQVLVHMGVGTSIYNGRGFEFLVSEGTKVRPGTPLVRLDRRFFDLQNADLTIFMVVTNQKAGEYRLLEGDNLVAGKTPVMEKKLPSARS